MTVVSPIKPNTIFTITLPFLFLSSTHPQENHHHHNQQQPLSQSLFPPNDEYDFTILNPETFFGAPYGGFARATSSRLARLPLRILGDGFDFFQDPENDSKETETEDSSSHPHVSIRDYQGRSYACRVYHGDELSETSRIASIFDLASFPDSDSDSESDDSTSPSQSTTTTAIPTLSSTSTAPTMITITPAELTLLSNKLTGACSQIHLGWWSYEWCYRQSFHQFHIALTDDPSVPGYGPKYSVENAVSLGEWKSEKIIITPKMAAEGMLWMEEEFEGGDMCEESGMEREVSVAIRCCEGEEWERLLARKSKKVMSSSSTTMKDKDYRKAVLLKVEEKETCSYKAEACTPIICKSSLMTLGEKEMEYPPTSSSLSSSEKMKDAPIREILKQTLSNRCLTKNAGWWIYEFCHEKHARQYHSQTLLDQFTGKTRSVVEAQHKLGLYQPPSYPTGEEHLHMLNITSSSSKYFLMEYPNGDVCDHEDVTDAAIHGGTIAEKGGVVRSVTMRFTCGKFYELLNVNEDSTCHYVMDVTVPELCGHRLFQEEKEVVKEQVVKCLPVEY